MAQIIFFILVGSAYLFIFWFFCECCEWKEGKSIRQMLWEKKGIASASLIVLCFFAAGMIWLGHSLEKEYPKQECPKQECPETYQDEYLELNTKVKTFCNKHKRASICK